MELNKIYQGDVLTVLKSWPDAFVDCCVTSPPYWGLRDYGVPGQLGLEPTFQEYIAKLIQIFTEVKRVLKDTGTCWVNLGDTYSGMKIGNSDLKNKNINSKSFIKPPTFLPDKSLCCIPDRFKIAMVDNGWICRNELIWFKRNCMPASVKDRFTVDFEKIFFFTKQGKYWFEQQFEENTSIGKTGWEKTGRRDYGKQTAMQGADNDITFNPRGRNMRCVWDITTQPFKEAHFAVFPPELPERCIKAGCPKEICNKCGKARERVWKKTGEFQRRWSKNNADGSPYNKQDSMQNEYQETGYTDCGCNAGFNSGIVLDPFMGSGTTAVVAKKLGRQWVGIELNEAYIEMANRRISDTVVNGELNL